MTEYTDSHRKRLIDYPRPSVAVDTAVLTVRDGELCIVLVAADTAAGRAKTLATSARRLPGTFLHEGETLADAVRRSLEIKAGIRGMVPRQLHVFDAPDRDDRGRVLSVAHLLAVGSDALVGVELVPVAEATGLAFDHDEIVRLALTRLRDDHREHPDPFDLLGDQFTLLELQRLHEAIDPATPKRDTFRRTMLRHLVETGEIRLRTVGKPARLFRHA